MPCSKHTPEDGHGNLKGTGTRGGTAVAQLVEALRYKSEGRGFDS